MKKAEPIQRLPVRDEEGYILVAVIFMLAILVISMAIAVPRVRESIQRDREVETMHRGKQYIRAIQLYYRKFHRYPPNVDALVKTNEIRFLRKRYADPMTGKDDWKPIMFGQNKAPVAMGFFGQALGGATLAGTGPGGVAGASPIGGTGSSGSGSSLMGGSALSNGSSFSGGSSFSSGSSFGGGSSMFGSNGTGSPGSPTGTTAGGTGTGAGSTDSSSSSSSGPSMSSTQTFGGGGIIGFAPGNEKQSILTYKKKNHYNEWEFTYSYLTDQKTMQGGNAGTIGQPVGGTGGSGLFGGGSSGLGSSSVSPTSPPPPISPTTPQQ